jgi:hypothetical protein
MGGATRVQHPTAVSDSDQTSHHGSSDEQRGPIRGGLPQLRHCAPAVSAVLQLLAFIVYLPLILVLGMFPLEMKGRPDMFRCVQVMLGL